MSDDNVIDLFPDVADPEAFDKNTRDQILLENKEEMLDALKGFLGRVEAFDIQGLIIFGFGKNVCDDTVFTSRHTLVDVAKTVGALEFVKQDMIDERLREVKDE